MSSTQLQDNIIPIVFVRSSILLFPVLNLSCHVLIFNNYQIFDWYKSPAYPCDKSLMDRTYSLKMGFPFFILIMKSFPNLFYASL